MPDDTTQVVISQAQAAEGQQDIAPEQPNTQATTWTPEAAEAEIKALRNEAAKCRNEKKAAERAREAAEAQALAEQGKYKELYEQATPRLAEYDTLRERYDAVIAAVQETNARRIAAIPDAMKSLVPEYDDPLKTAAWLDANAAVFQKPAAPSLDGRAGGNNGAGVTVTDDEVREFASRFRLNPEHIDRAQLARLKR